MSKIKKSLIALALSAAAVGSASAVNVGGIEFDPSQVTFDVAGNFDQVFSGPILPGAVTTGWGSVTAIDGANEAAYCNLGINCKLTFVFSYTVDSVGGLPPPFPLSFTGGSLQVYVDNDAAADTSVAAASDGALWLDMSGNALALFLSNGGFFPFGPTLNVVFNGGAAQGVGYVDVVGGMASLHFDTNTLVGGSDMQFTTTDPLSNTTFGGTFTLTGAAQVVPEPASLALVGLGLLGIAGMRRRKVA